MLNLLVLFFSFYRKTCQVKTDPELQAFANEVSSEGTNPPDGGKGMVWL